MSVNLLSKCFVLVLVCFWSVSIQLWTVCRKGHSHIWWHSDCQRGREGACWEDLLPHALLDTLPLPGGGLRQQPCCAVGPHGEYSNAENAKYCKKRQTGKGSFIMLKCKKLPLKWSFWEPSSQLYLIIAFCPSHPTDFLSVAPLIAIRCIFWNLWWGN